MRSLRHSARIGAMLAAGGIFCAGAPMCESLAATVTDAGGRKVEVVDTSKILSIGGDITEILYALGLGSRIVAVDSTSQFPADALKQKGNVGYMRALSTEGVLSVGASLIIASERSGPTEVVKALKQTAIPYVEVHDGLSPEGVIEKVRFVAQTSRPRRKATSSPASSTRSSRRWPRSAPRSSGLCVHCFSSICRVAVQRSVVRAPAPMPF